MVINSVELEKKCIEYQTKGWKVNMPSPYADILIPQDEIDSIINLAQVEVARWVAYGAKNEYEIDPDTNEEYLNGDYGGYSADEMIDTHTFVSEWLSREGVWRYPGQEIEYDGYEQVYREVFDDRLFCFIDDAIDDAIGGGVEDDDIQDQIDPMVDAMIYLLGKQSVKEVYLQNRSAGEQLAWKDKLIESYSEKSKIAAQLIAQTMTYQWFPDLKNGKKVDAQTWNNKLKPALLSKIRGADLFIIDAFTLYCRPTFLFAHDIWSDCYETINGLYSEFRKELESAVFPYNLYVTEAEVERAIAIINAPNTPNAFKQQYFTNFDLGREIIPIGTGFDNVLCAAESKITRQGVISAKVVRDDRTLEANVLQIPDNKMYYMGDVSRTSLAIAILDSMSLTTDKPFLIVNDFGTELVSGIGFTLDKEMQNLSSNKFCNQSWS